MSTTKETRSDAATPKRDVGTAAIGSATAPTKDSTRSSGKRQDLFVSNFLGVGESSALTARHLKDILHCDSRTLRRLIEQERQQGIPILSNNQTGYFLAGNNSEIERFVRSMRHRADEIIKTASAIEGSGTY